MDKSPTKNLIFEYIMVTTLKKYLFLILGLKNYLKLLHKGFMFSYSAGFLKSDYIYKYHYFVKNIVEEGDHVVDLGANLGYFSKIFSGLVKSSGKVICIEPVVPFFKTLEWAMQGKGNVVLHNKALGTENKMVTMSLPIEKNNLRPGLAHISNTTEKAEKEMVFEVEMVKGSELLSALPKIDFIKCDIEGYEEFVFPEIKSILEKYQPIVQIETWDRHKIVIFNLMEALNFVPYLVLEQKLVAYSGEDKEFGDYLFIPKTKEASFLEKMKRKNCL